MGMKAATADGEETGEAALEDRLPIFIVDGVPTVEHSLHSIHCIAQEVT